MRSKNRMGTRRTALRIMGAFSIAPLLSLASCSSSDGSKTSCANPSKDGGTSTGGQQGTGGGQQGTGGGQAGNSHIDAGHGGAPHPGTTPEAGRSSEDGGDHAT